MNENFEVLSEASADNETTYILRMETGTEVVCRVPLHTHEEEAEIYSDFALACMRMMYPDKDLPSVKTMRIICGDGCRITKL